MIKTFKGQLDSGAQTIIRLGTIRGEIGYRIVKFEIITPNAGTTDYEHTIKIFKVKQPDLGGGVFATADIDFSNSQLLAAAFTEGAAATNFIGNPLSVIFDSEKFNQDIFVTQFDTKSGLPCNYYIELEQVKLDLNEATVATLKDMRGSS